MKYTMLLPSAVKLILELQDTRNTFVSLWGFVFDTQLGFSLLALPRAGYLKFLAIIIPDFPSFYW